MLAVVVLTFTVWHLVGVVMLAMAGGGYFATRKWVRRQAVTMFKSSEWTRSVTSLIDALNNKDKITQSRLGSHGEGIEWHTKRLDKAEEDLRSLEQHLVSSRADFAKTRGEDAVSLQSQISGVNSRVNDVCAKVTSIQNSIVTVPSTPSWSPVSVSKIPTAWKDFIGLKEGVDYDYFKNIAAVPKNAGPVPSKLGDTDKLRKITPLVPSKLGNISALRKAAIDEEMYIRASLGLPDPLTSLLASVGLPHDASFEQLKNALTWKTGTGIHSMKKRLVNCDTEHLENILSTVRGSFVNVVTRHVILSILKDRYTCQASEGTKTVS